MRRFSCLVTILSLLAPFTYARDLVKRSAVLPQSPIEKGPEMCQAKENFSIFSGRSQRNFVKLIENVENNVCPEIDMGASSEKLNENYCIKVNQCQDYQNEKSALSEDEKVFLWKEAMVFLVKENAKEEMDKYLSQKADSFKDLMAYVKKLPEKYHIQACESEQAESDKCLDTPVLNQNPVFDQMAKSYISESFYGHV
ncbi:MAG: hypothetical protein ACXVCE_18200, partial [Bacteriovorax sp.]